MYTVKSIGAAWRTGGVLLIGCLALPGVSAWRQGRLGAAPAEAGADKHQLSSSLHPITEASSHSLDPSETAPERTVVTQQGVSMPRYRYRKPPPLDAGSAAWVWIPGPPIPQGRTQDRSVVTCFRKQIAVGRAPARAYAWVSADWHYRLYVNGRLVSRGPADPGADYPGGKSPGMTGLYYADWRDLTPYIRTGANVISAEVFTERISDWYGSSGNRGFWLSGELSGMDGKILRVQTDASWRAMNGDYLTNSPRGLAQFAEKEPIGWRMPGFDDSDWSLCADAGRHWPGLRASELSPPMEIVYPVRDVARPVGSVTMPSQSVASGAAARVTGESSFAVRYNRVLSGYVRVRVRGGRGSRLTIRCNERDAPGGRRSMSFVLGDGDQAFETPFYSSFSVLNVEADRVTAPFDIVDISAIYSSSPVAYRGSFECSSEPLNRLWRSARWATQLCMQDHYLDSPDHQEPICDPGDYMIEALLNFYAFDEPALTRQDLRKFGALLGNNDYITFHTSYALLWLQMLMDYYDYTGDEGLVRELAPRVHGLLDRFTSWRGANGLISEAPDYMFMDWVDIAGTACHHPPAVIGQGYMTAFYYRALADGIRVARLTSDTRRMEGYAAIRRSVSAAFEKELWNDKLGRYRDGKPFRTHVQPSTWLPADREVETASPHVNTLAVLVDLAPKSRQADIMRRVLGQSPLNVQPYFMHFVFNALAHCGLFDAAAPGLMARWRIDPVTQTFPEMWSGGDMSHAWGGTPLYQLSARVLGIVPEKPGFRTVAIRPVLCGLRWARGTAPTPYGEVKVAWRAGSGTLDLDVQVPRGADARVTVPVATFKNARVTVDGRSPAYQREAHVKSAELTVRVSAGSHRFHVSEIESRR